MPIAFLFQVHRPQYVLEWIKWDQSKPWIRWDWHTMFDHTWKVIQAISWIGLDVKSLIANYLNIPSLKPRRIIWISKVSNPEGWCKTYFEYMRNSNSEPDPCAQELKVFDQIVLLCVLAEGYITEYTLLFKYQIHLKNLYFL